MAVQHQHGSQPQQQQQQSQGNSNAMLGLGLLLTPLGRQALQLSAWGVGNVWNLNTALARNTLSTLSRAVPGLPSPNNNNSHSSATYPSCKAEFKTGQNAHIPASKHGLHLHKPGKEHRKAQASLQKGAAAFAVAPGQPLSLNASKPLVGRPPARVPQVASDDWVHVNIGLQSSML